MAQLTLPTRVPRLDLHHKLVFREILTMGLDSMRADKIRAAMTALGMAVGTAALILVVTVALTGKVYVLAQIEAVGTNVIWAEYNGASSAGTSTGISDYLTIQDMETVERQVPGIAEASAVFNSHQRMVVGSGKEKEILVLAVDPEYRSIRRLVVTSGRFFDKQDDDSGSKVAVITDALALETFGSLDLALGQRIKVHEVPFFIIGTFHESVDTMGRSEVETDTVLVPYKIARAMTGSNYVNQIYFSMANSNRIPEATNEIHDVIAARHRPESTYNVSNMTEVLRLAKKTANAFTAVLLLFAAVTLIAAGVGIMNIMLSTVHSRIHEIGVRMAIGATRRSILLQFLVEAVLIALLGGIVGIVVGLGVPIAVQVFGKVNLTISPTSAFIALFVSCLVGVAFGITPANNASRLDPVECLRHE